nr:unnamed protein product [Callosobruchus chinensis]
MRMISKYFSPEIQRGIVTRGLFSFEEVDEYLRELDEIFAAERDNPSNMGNRNNAIKRTQGRDHNSSGRAANNDNSHEVWQITKFNEEPDYLGSDTESDEDEGNKAAVNPVFQANIGEETCDILVDSGSEITAVSEELYRVVSSNMTIPTLPVTNVSLAVAVGGKKQKVKQQVMLPMEFKGRNNIKLDIICLVVPDLNCKMLVECDWLSAHGAKVDFTNRLIKFSVGNEHGQVPFLGHSIDDNGVNKCSKIYIAREEYSDTEVRGVVEKSNIDDIGKQDLYTLLCEFRGIFSECTGVVKSYVHHVDMIDTEPFYCQNYPIPLTYKEEVDSQIKEMIDWGVVRKEKTNYISPLVVVRKKDSSARICLDARAINKKMKKDFVGPPNSSEMLFNFKKGMLFSTLDLTASYWQIPIADSDAKYIGFIYEGESYVFARLPFGLSTSMASLIRCLSQILNKKCSQFTIIYVDDILVYSEDVSTHLKHLRQIFEILAEEGMTLKLRKCQFLPNQVSFLGHVIGSERVKVDPERTYAIEHFPTPRNLRELSSFLGLVNYDRRFCDHYSDLTIPLLKLLRKNQPWIWGKNESTAFAEIKKAYLCTTLMVHPHYDKTFFIQCDASDYAVAGSLFQLSEEGERQVIAYTSATLKGSQLRYKTTEKEMWAVLHCLKRWRTLVLARDLKIVSDHKALSFVMSCKLRPARLCRWILLAQEFDFEMIHCPGSQNVVADTLSRYVPVKNLHITPDRMSPRLMLTKLSDEYSKLRLNFDNMREDQMADKWITDKIKYLEDLQGSVAILSEKQARICEWFVMHRGILFKRGDISEGAKLCVPKAHIRELVMAHHRDFGHFGKTKVYLHMRERFFWPNMQKHIRQLVASCDICQKVMCAEKCHGPLNSVLPERPGDLVCTDLIGPLPPSRGGCGLRTGICRRIYQVCATICLKESYDQSNP